MNVKVYFHIDGKTYRLRWVNMHDTAIWTAPVA